MADQVFIPAEVIRSKRDGNPLTPHQIQTFIKLYVNGSLPDYQAAALLMAIFFRGMTGEETNALTQAMLHSGAVVDLSSIPGPKIDKHSTGGVGDKTSLVLGPVAAAAGVTVPMISGRGLGHTGGTLDKLEAIPGFNTQLDLTTFRHFLGKFGVCFIGQTAEICPADKKLYALRDVTGTVESIPLICASIMSKKLAEGIDGLVLDVKFGSGAFMKTEAEAAKLAQNLKSIGLAAGKKVTALLTGMEQPLGKAIGNALEIQECVAILQGGGPEDCAELSIQLSAQMILMGEKASTLLQAEGIARQLIQSGKAFEIFERVVQAQGGNLQKLPKAGKFTELKARESGFVARIDTEAVGMASLILGGGRVKTSDKIDPAVGIVVEKKLGDSVHRGDVLATLFFNDDSKLEAAQQKLLAAYGFSLQKPSAQPLIKAVL